MITLKSTKEGLEFWISNADSYAEIKKELMEILAANRNFYRGTNLPANFLGWEFTELQKRELSAFLGREYGIFRVHFIDDAKPQPEQGPGRWFWRKRACKSRSPKLWRAVCFCLAPCAADSALNAKGTL